MASARKEKAYRLLRNVTGGSGESLLRSFGPRSRGTPEELDAELGRELAGYVECHRALGSTLAAAEAEMDAAAKAALQDAGA